MVPMIIAHSWLLASEQYHNAYMAGPYATDAEWQSHKQAYHCILNSLVAGQKCAYCGIAAETFDHIVPKAHGGTDSHTNLNFTCRSCNRSKGRKTLKDWFTFCITNWKKTRNEVWLRRINGISALLLEDDETWQAPE